ncbi:uncharacterized protein [Primulina huaijiensis]|uniref:uncharacterized protein isoform X2 n=1 Tax=Primulina huaijiensis TaxID=1492673 RepID=UPI003CC6E656
MTRESKFLGKYHFHIRDKEDTQPHIIFASHVTRNSKERECPNIQGMLNNQTYEVSKQQHNDVQAMTLKNKNVGNTHIQLQDKTNAQPLILIDDHTTRNSKERVYHTRELENVVISGKDCQSIQGASRNQIDEASNQKDIELQGLTSRITFNNNPHAKNGFMDEESDHDWMFRLNKKSI